MNLKFGKKHTNNKVGYYNGLVVKKDTKGRFITKSSKKHYLPKGTRVHSEKVKSLKAKKITKKPQKETKKQKKYKDVKGPTKKLIGKRLSARVVFDERGTSSIGKSYNILQPNGSMKMKVLRLRKNGSPYFANKFGKKNLFGHNHSHFGHVHNCFG